MDRRIIHDDNRGTFYRLTKFIETMDHNITVNRTFNRNTAKVTLCL